MKVPAKKALLIIFGLILGLWIAGNLTNAFQDYRVPTAANEPAIKQNSILFASNLLSPKRLDFICFYAEPVEGSDRELRIFRLCGLEGDIIEIKNGDLFVNNEAIDKKISLEHNYFLTRRELEKTEEIITIQEESIVYKNADTLCVPLEDNFVKENKIMGARQVLPKTFEDPEIVKAFSKPWNQDNFGPIKVPANKYFVLGDNRHNALDSRYSGFIDKKDFVSTVLWKR
jgi:signal peptidase I